MFRVELPAYGRQQKTCRGFGKSIKNFKVSNIQRVEALVSSRERTPSAGENGCVHNWCLSLTLRECKNTEFVLICVEKTEVF